MNYFSFDFNSKTKIILYLLTRLLNINPPRNPKVVRTFYGKQILGYCAKI